MLHQHRHDRVWLLVLIAVVILLFAAQACAVNKDLGWDTDKVNVNGGAIALGHPIGATGARIVVTLVHELARRGGTRGLATLCMSGGMGMAMELER